MITLPNGNKFRDKPNDPLTLDGYIPMDKHPNILVQQFLPCKFREMKVCSTCPKNGKKSTRPSCQLKKITVNLTCVGCLERKSN